MRKSRRTRKPYASVQAWMDALGLNQQQAADKLGVSNTHLCNLLRRRRSCSLKLALRIARVANVPVESIVDEPVSKYGDVA